MVWIGALLVELFEILAGMSFWQMVGLTAAPVLTWGMFRVVQAATEPLPPPAQQSPVQTAVGGVAAVAGGTGQAVGSAGQFVRDNLGLLLVGGAALFVLTRR